MFQKEFGFAAEGGALAGVGAEEGDNNILDFKRRGQARGDGAERVGIFSKLGGGIEKKN